MPMCYELRATLLRLGMHAYKPKQLHCNLRNVSSRLVNAVLMQQS